MILVAFISGHSGQLRVVLRRLPFSLSVGFFQCKCVVFSMFIVSVNIIGCVL